MPKIATFTKNHKKSTEQIKTLTKNEEEDKNTFQVNSFSDLINLAEKKKEIELKFDLERNVKLVRFENGKIDINFNENLNKNFIKNLTEKLLLWTGKRWIITLSKSKGEKTIFEKKKEKQNEEIIKFKDNKKFKEILEYFPDAKIDKIDGDNDA